MVAPVLDIQDRLNYQTFLLMTTGEHGAHRQRWAAGLELDDDEEPPIGPDRLHSDSPETRFGTFDSTDKSGYVAVLEQILRHLAAVTQTPVWALHGSLSNLAADTIAAADAGLQRRVGERKTSYGESWQQTLRLSCLAAGDEAGWLDTTSVTRWRDTSEPLATLAQLKARPGVNPAAPDAEARALTALVDAANPVRAELPPALLTPTIPPAVVTIVCQAAGRAVRNPEGYSSETAGQYTYRYGDDATSGVYLTEHDHKVLRRLARRSDPCSIRTPYSAEPDDDGPYTLPVLGPDGQLAEPMLWEEPPP